MVKKLVASLFVFLLVGVVYLHHAYGAVLSGGSGYAAKNICSGHFISGFPPEVIKREALETASGVLSNVSYELNAQERHVTTKLFGLFKRRAIYTQGIGCTLLPAGELQATMQLTPIQSVAVPPEVSWPHGSAQPESSGRFGALLDAAFAETDSDKPRNTKAIVVIHQGALVAEKYASGVTPETPLLGWSMAKSVTALMVGILVGDGELVLKSPAPLPQWREAENIPQADITLDELMRMSSGLEFNETYSARTDVTQMLANEPDVAAYAASKAMAGPPDTIWSYSSGTTNIISAIIRNSVGGTLQDYYAFSQERLFQPLGIRSGTFEADRSGNFIGSSYLYASARDWARLGQFCLQDGIWNGRQILPEGWMGYLTTPTPTASSNEYGAQFWLNRQPDDPEMARQFPSLPEDAYFMSGYQGQVVLVVPSEELVIARFGFTPARNHGVEELASAIIAELNRS